MPEKTRFLFSGCLVYGILLIYASLMPFDFSFDINFEREIRNFWIQWPVNPKGRISGSDLLSNLVLYLPLGWLVCTWLRLKGASFFSSLFFTMILCSSISIFVEIMQMLSYSRVASGADWVLNTISGFTGSFAGGVSGKKFWVNLIKWQKKTWKENPAAMAGLIIFFLITADSVSPFLPSIKLKYVWRSIKGSEFDIVKGFQAHPWHWWLVLKVFVFAVLTLVAMEWTKRKNSLLTAFSIIIFISFLEVSKLFILSRYMNIANIVSGWAGVFAGMFFSVSIGRELSLNKKLDYSIIFLILYIFYLAWFPFEFNWDLERAELSIPSLIRLIPLYDYAMGATLNHARLFIQSIFLQGLLIYLLRVRFGWFENKSYGVLQAMIFCAVGGFLQEAGQVFIVSRTPSPTDIYCFAIGGMIGGLVKRTEKEIK